MSRPSSRTIEATLSCMSKKRDRLRTCFFMITARPKGRSKICNAGHKKRGGGWPGGDGLELERLAPTFPTWRGGAGGDLSGHATLEEMACQELHPHPGGAGAGGRLAPLLWCQPLLPTLDLFGTFGDGLELRASSSSSSSSSSRPKQIQGGGRARGGRLACQELPTCQDRI